MTNSQRLKRNWTALVAAGAALVALTAGTVPAVADTGGRPASSALPALDREALRQSIAGLPDDTMSGALLRVTGRDGRWTGISGVSVPSADAHFRIGSITKLFTAAVTLQLVGEGRVRLDDTVSELAPGLLPDGYEGITVGQFLSHTSGLQKPTCFRPGTPAEVIASSLSCGTPTTPGATYRYNGINYFVIGMLIERITGRTYAEEVRDRIVRPLGLRHTYVPDADDWSIPAPHTRGLTAVPGSSELKDVSCADPYAWAEGGMISDAPELSRFLTALLGGRLLRHEQQELLFTIPEDVPGAVYSYGGVMRSELPSGVVVWGKSGAYPGYASGAFATRDLRRVLVYSTNPTGRDVAKETERVMRIAGAAFGTRPSAP